MAKNHLPLLIKLSELGAVGKPIFTSTTSLAKELGCSQQSASRLLKKIGDEGYVERKIVFRGEYVQVTKLGLNELIEIHAILTSALRPSEPSPLIIRGRLFTGYGEGEYYITREGYSRQIENKLGFKPYPGTLNLRLISPQDIAVRNGLEKLDGIVIEGFTNGQRTYGPFKCIPAWINGKAEGCVLLIQRTHYNSSVVEVIAPVYLREALKIKDNDIVTLKIFTQTKRSQADL